MYFQYFCTMNNSIFFSIIFFLSLSVMSQKSIYDININDINGDAINMNDFRGKNLLIVNVASKCGFTYQYEGLEDLYNEHKDKLVIIGVPCNQFGGQEPGSNEEIVEFCKLNYRNTFPVFSKIEVKGNDAHPLFAFLTNEKKGLLGTGAIKWNFTKFLINREGEPVNRYAPSTTPDKIRSDIEALI